MASLLKYILMSQSNHQNIQNFPFKDAASVLETDAWSPSKWLYWNFEMSNFLCEDRKGKEEMLKRLAKITSLFFPVPPNNWVVTMDPQFFVELAPRNAILKEVEYVDVTTTSPATTSSSPPAEDANDEELLVCLETSFNGNGIESLSRVGRHLLSHRTEKKYTNITKYIENLSTDGIYAWMLSKSIRVFKGLFVESCSSKIFRSERPELYKFDINLPTLGTLLNLKTNEKYSPVRKVYKLSKPKQASEEFRKQRAERLEEERQRRELEAAGQSQDADLTVSTNNAAGKKGKNGPTPGGSRTTGTIVSHVRGKKRKRNDSTPSKSATNAAIPSTSSPLSDTDAPCTEEVSKAVNSCITN